MVSTEVQGWRGAVKIEGNLRWGLRHYRAKAGRKYFVYPRIDFYKPRNENVLVELTSLNNFSFHVWHKIDLKTSC